MKVAYFALSEVYGGHDAGFVHSHSVVSFLHKAGVEVKLVIGKPPNDIKTDVDCVFVTLPRISNVLKINPFSYFKSFFEIRKKLKDVSLVHERFHVNPIDLLFLGNRKYVLEVNDPAIELAHGFKKMLYKVLVKMKYNRADAIIVQTETLKKIVSKHTNTPIFVIPNGVDTSRFRPIMNQKRYWFPESSIIVTFIGSFREWHGMFDIVRIAKLMPDTMFLLVGNGKLFNEVKEHASGLDNVVLTGAIDHDLIPGTIAGSDILIAPFNTNGFPELDEYGFWWCPVKLFEYMASGKPIVSYDYPEVRKIVGNSGLLAKPDDFEELARLVKRLVNNKELRNKLGRKANDIAKKQYDWSNRVNELKKIYDGL
jgi:glycosyltransferase involved in cell wall biosynthesis